MVQLRTKKQVWEALGRAPGISKITGANYKTAFASKYGETFPAKNYPVMIDALRKKGMSAPASLWGMTESPGP